MKNKFSTTLLLSVLIGFLSCETEEGPNHQPDGAALKALMDEVLEDNTEHFVLDAGAGGMVEGSKGTVVHFNADGFLTQDDEPVTGPIDIELVAIYKRSTMLLGNRPTLGKRKNGDMAMLISGGEFYVNVTQDGKPLKPSKTFQIVAPTGNTGGTDGEMDIFKGMEECDGDRCDIVWEEDSLAGIEIGEFQGTGGVFAAYYAFISQFGWTNIDRWYNDERPKTTIFVDVPDGYDNTNCAVFLLYSGEPAALGRFDVYNEDTGLFTEHYGLIPIGLEVHFVFVSIVDDTIHYAIQSATIEENHLEVIDEVHTTTLAALIELVDALP